MGVSRAPRATCNMKSAIWGILFKRTGLSSLPKNLQQLTIISATAAGVLRSPRDAGDRIAILKKISKPAKRTRLERTRRNLTNAAKGKRFEAHGWMTRAAASRTSSKQFARTL